MQAQVGSCEKFTLEDVKADTAKFVDVGMEDLGKKSDLGRRHGVVIGEEEFELENAACNSVNKGPLRYSARWDADLHTETGRAHGSRRQSIAGFLRGARR